jgi:alpha-L-rhamnosidase
MELLTSQDKSDLAYDIAVKTTYPSWGYMIEKGATTLWELWQLRQGPSMNSHNHPMFGSVGAWLYKALAGISLEPASVAFEKIRIAPQMVRDLSFASGSLRTQRGEVSSSWSRGERCVRLEAAVPVGSVAEIVLPKFNIANVVISESGRPVWKGGAYQPGASGVQGVEEKTTNFIVRVGSGRYALELTGD